MPKWAKILIGLIAIIIVIIVGFLIYVNTAFISKDDVKENLAKHLNILKDDIYFENIDLEMEKNQYEIDFYYNNKEYEAKVDAKEGKIIYTDFPLINTTTTSTTSNNGKGQNSPSNNSQQQEINLEEAKTISLEHANLDKNSVTLIKAEIEHDGQGMYEIEWKDNSYKYDFTISRSGNVLKYEKENLS